MTSNPAAKPSAARAASPAPASLDMARPGSRLEVDADLAGERAADGRFASLASCGPPGAGDRRPVAAPAAAAARAALRSAGAPLAPEVRAAFEPAFDHDFGRVRVHADAPAAHAARALGAAAFAVGADIGFGEGRFAPRSPAGLKLIGHELAHVVQSGAGGGSLLFRAESTEAAAAAVHTIGIAVTADETIEPSRFIILTAGSADLGTLYAGDVLTLVAYDEASDELTVPVTWTLPPDFEQVWSSGGRIRFRVRSTTPTVTEIGLTPEGGGRVALEVAVDAAPARPAINPEAERVASERERVREARRTERAAFRSARAERRAADRATRREQRRAHRAAQREMRREARALRRAERQLERASPCKLATERTVQRSLERAAEVAGAAHAALGARGADDPQIQDLLKRCMRWRGGDTTALVTRMLDTLAVARNSMLAAVQGDFACTGGCAEKTGAFVAQGSRGGIVTLCQQWTGGSGLEFPVARELAEARAYALLHEFIHLSGAMADDEQYFGTGDWTALSQEEAIGMPDGYAAFAWLLAGGAGGAQ